MGEKLLSCLKIVIYELTLAKHYNLCVILWCTPTTNLITKVIEISLNIDFYK